jgi:hypothetical protein
MEKKINDIFGLIAAVLLVFTPMLHPLITVAMGIALLLGMGVLRFMQKKNKNN